MHLKLNLGFVLIRCCKTADMRMIVVKEINTETGGTARHAGPCGRGQGWSGRTGEGNTAQSLYWAFLGEEWLRQGRYAE